MKKVFKYLNFRVIPKNENKENFVQNLLNDYGSQVVLTEDILPRYEVRDIVIHPTEQPNNFKIIANFVFEIKE